MELLNNEFILNSLNFTKAMNVCSDLGINQIYKTFTSKNDLIKFDVKPHKGMEKGTNFGNIIIKTALLSKSLPNSLKNKNLLLYSGSHDSIFNKNNIDSIVFYPKLKTELKEYTLNQVICNHLKNNNISYSIPLRYLYEPDKYMIKTITNNLLLCIKFDIPINIAAFSDSIYDIRSLYDKRAILDSILNKKSK